MSPNECDHRDHSRSRAGREAVTVPDRGFLAQKEGDWQEAVDDVIEGDEPDAEPDEPASSGP